MCAPVLAALLSCVPTPIVHAPIVPVTIVISPNATTDPPPGCDEADRALIRDDLYVRSRDAGISTRPIEDPF